MYKKGPSIWNHLLKFDEKQIEYYYTILPIQIEQTGYIIKRFWFCFPFTYIYVLYIILYLPL